MDNAHLYHLSNGIPVIICNSAFQTCKILVSLNFGARDENSSEYGITHFIEHLLGQSVTGESTFGNLQKQIEKLGGNVNLYTNYSRIGFWVNVIPENIVDVVKIIALQIMNPIFDVQKIEQEKTVILDEYRRSADNKSWLVFKYTNLFKNTGLGHDILGTPETIQSFTKEVLSDYYFSHLSNDKCNIVIVGQVNNTQKLLSELENGFGKMPCISYEHNIQPIQQTVAHNLKSSDKNIKLALGFDAQVSDERKNQIIASVFMTILQKRLMKVLRYEKGLVYTIKCPTVGVMNTKLYTIETENSVRYIENIVKNIAIVCKNILSSEQITAEELQIAKNVFKYSLLRDMDSIDASCGIYAQYMAYYHKLYDVNTDKQILDGLTLDSVISAGLVLLNAPLSIVTQGPEYNCDIVDVWKKYFC